MIPEAASLRVTLLLPALLLGSASGAGTLAAQEPPDTVAVTDSVELFPDTIPPDSLAPDPDTIFYNLPDVKGGPPASGFVTGIWTWDRHAIMASGANTLGELFGETPGVITLLGGDYGTPLSMSFAGQGGAGYRIFRDGFELYTLEGGVVDLQHVPLVGIGRIRLDRSMGQMIVEMWSHEYFDGRPFSVIEAGTGDLDTNLFRGVFADPSALFGSVAGGLERVDTRGRNADRSKGGNRTGSWVRYQLHLRDRFGVGFDYRRNQAQTREVSFVPTTARTDLMVRAGLRIAEGVTLQAYAADSDFTAERDTVDAEFGGTRSQIGTTLGVERPGLWLRGSWRSFGGDLPSRRIDAAGGFTLERWGGLSARYGRGDWNDTSTRNYAARAWVSPVRHVTVFSQYETGTFGARSTPVVDGAAPAPPDGLPPAVEAITDRETFRLGLSLTGWGITLAGASLYAYSDVALPLSTELDLGAPTDTGVHRNGYEARAILPTGVEGLTLEGSYAWWDEEGPYLPKQSYQGAFEFNRVFKETGNLEFWVSAGVRGHDPMLSFVAEGPDPGDGSGPVPGGVQRVPFYQSWYGRLQIRVLTVRLWIGIDNASLRRDLQKYPELRLPLTRTTYAIRWDLWN